MTENTFFDNLILDAVSRLGGYIQPINGEMIALRIPFRSEVAGDHPDITIISRKILKKINSENLLDMIAFTVYAGKLNGEIDLLSLLSENEKYTYAKISADQRKNIFVHAFIELDIISPATIDFILGELLQCIGAISKLPGKQFMILENKHYSFL